MRLEPAAVAILVVLATSAGTASAQTVRGTVTEETTTRPLSGVLIGIASANGAMAAGDTAFVLTNTRGEYAVRLPRAGDYSLIFKRIGVERRVIAVRLDAGQARQLDVVLNPVPARLPNTTVVASGLCVPRSEQLPRLGALWEEVRTVLRASQVTDRDEGPVGLQTHYVRLLDPRRVSDPDELRILDDDRVITHGVWKRPWASVDVEWLNTAGFWGSYGADSAIYHGPDASVLLAPEFLQQYCFGLVDGRGLNAGLTGIEFRPRRAWLQRRIEGTMWIDASTFELRSVAFRYLGLPPGPYSELLGGEVHFVRHEAGGWIVQRWRLRMPGYAAGGRALVDIEEEGGFVYSADLRSGEQRSTVTGVVLDSTGKAPLRAATVTLPGTPFTSLTDSSGAFRFDSVVPGAHVVRVRGDDYAAFGLPTGATPFSLKSGREHAATVRAYTNAELLEEMCGRGRVDKDDASVRVGVVATDDERPVPGISVSLRWDDAKRRVPITVLDRGTAGHMSSLGVSPQYGVAERTDSLGFLTFCGVPSNRPLFLYVERPGAQADSLNLSDPVVNWTLPPGTLEMRTVRVRRER